VSETAPPTPATPRVTLGIATYNRDTYLGEAVASCLAQDYESLEVLVVLDGTTNPAVEAVLAQFDDDPRLRIVRHETNRGIAAAYNTFVSEGRGELIAMLGDDDVCLPGRIRRQVELFDRHPGSGVVHGDAVVIDAAGRETGAWRSADLSPGALVQSFYRRNNFLVDPSRMVHRRVYEAVGGYDPRFRLAQDLDFWLRAAQRFRFRHVGGAPLIRLRRHGENGSDETARGLEVADVSLALGKALERYPLRELVPELDWAVLDPEDARRQGLERLATQVERRDVPLQGFAAELRRRAAACAAPATPAPRNGRRLMITMFGWEDSGGGTTIPRIAAKELVRRGWEVTVFHASTRPTPSGMPYELTDTVSDGVRLIGVHNHMTRVFDPEHPAREIDDPEIRRAFGRALDDFAPDVVHFFNLHNLSASLMQESAGRGLPAYFSPNNYWLVCPQGYLMNGTGAMCGGPADGRGCATCVGHHDPEAYARRLTGIRAHAHRSLRAILSVSDAVANTLVAAGYEAEIVDVVRQAMPHDDEIHDRVGAVRTPGRLRGRLTVAFLGSAYPHKGPQLLIQAAQRCRAEVTVRILGEVSDEFRSRLRALDHRGVVEFWGSFTPTEIGGLLSDVDVAALPSMWWDCAPLAATECRAAGVAMLVPRLGGLAEVVRDGVDGLVFDGLDADDLARALDRLDSEPGLLERLQGAMTPPRRFAEYIDELEAYYAGERPGRRPQTRPAEDLAIRWQGDHGKPTSLSIINDRVSERLAGHVQRAGAWGTPGPGAPLPFSADVEVRHQWPPDLSPARAARLAVIQPWEFGAIPSDWLPGLEANVDELWVPSEYVRSMYVQAGLDPERVVVIPNGVDLERFSPAPEPRADRPDGGAGTRFLFVGGLVGRKGPDILFDAFTTAFPGRDDVTLVVKDFGADGIYRDGDRARLRDHAAAGLLPRIELIDRTLTEDELAELYRSCDALVTPYRGEGFCMPALEAMACGLPVIATAGGPTDEFVPGDAGWRIASGRRELPEPHISTLATHGRPWMLEPSVDDLVRCLREAEAAGPGERVACGARGRAAAHAFSWRAVADRYGERIAALAAAPARRAVAPHPLGGDVATRVLATPAWRGEDRLAELLAAWAAHTDPGTSARLYLLADTAVDGGPEALEARVLAAAAQAGADLDECADIDIVMEHARPERDEAIHAAADVYVPLHPACAGHERIAHRSGSAVVAPDGLAAGLGRERAEIGAA
jgi:glycosyltransferase involved in cell wall biosynthesis